jgi:hypothetical protein
MDKTFRLFAGFISRWDIRQSGHVPRLAILAGRAAPRPDAEAVAAAPSLKDKKAVVLYFATDTDRDELVEALTAAYPDMRAVNL